LGRPIAILAAVTETAIPKCFQTVKNRIWSAEISYLPSSQGST
jgi:hypothetical protein